MRVRSLLRLCLIVPALSVVAGCAARSDPDARGGAEPRLSWELLTGDRRGDERKVCDASTRDKCVLEVTTDTRRMLALVRLRLHPVGRETNYVGTVEIPFFDGPNRFGEVSLEVPADARPVNRSLLGRVTRDAGVYTMTFALDAFVTGSTSPVRIFEEVPVTVR